MASSGVQFFATRGDLEDLITAIEAVRQLAYVGTGLFDEPTVDLVESMLSIPEIGTAPAGSSIQCPSYLVAMRPFAPVVRSVPQRRGGAKYAVDQFENPATVVIQPGGLRGDSVVIAGSLGTVSTDPASLELFALFRREICARFSAIKSYWVGRDAARLLDAGGRLTASVKSPTRYDLARR